MASFAKRCHEKGCTKPKTCSHYYHFDFCLTDHQGTPRRAKGPVTKFMHLLPPKSPVPTTVEAVKYLESLVRVWLKQGAPAPTPAPSGDESKGTTDTRTIGDVCADYRTKHVAKMGDKGAPSIVTRIEHDFGKLPIGRLFDRALIREWLDEIEEDTSVVNRNRHHSRWSHMLNWSKGEYGIEGPWPFFHPIINPTGIRKGNEGDGRTRRLKAGEEQKLIGAFKKTDDGGMMLARFYAAIDCGFRRGEMLKIRRDHILRNYKTAEGITLPLVIKIEWGNAKTRRTRYVPVESPRLAKWLDTRRFSDYTFGQLDGTLVESFRQDWEAALLASGLEAGKWSDEKTTRNGHSWRQWMRTRDADLHWHDLRHECGSRLADRGMSPHQLKELLGHTDIETTQKYLNARVGDIAASMRKAARGR